MDFLTVNICVQNQATIFLKQRKDENILPFRFTNDCCFMSSVNNQGAEET
jgi:hypothetical protein